MANKLNQLNCFTGGGGGNVGRAACDFEPGPLIGEIYGPRLKEFALADTADDDAFLAALLAASVADSYTSRIFAVGTFQTVTPNGEARKEQTFDSGLKRLTAEARMQDDLLLVDAKCYHTSVKKTLHNQQNAFGSLKVHNQQDGTYAIVGRRARDNNGDNVMGFFGISSLYVSIYQNATFAGVGQFTITRGFTSATDVDSNYAVMIVNFNPLDELNGLQTAIIHATSTGPTNVTVKGAAGCGASDLRNTFGAALAVVGAFVVTNTLTGGVITVASVAMTSTGYALTLAATGTDPDNPGTGGSVTVKLAAPSVLAALGTPVEGIESTTVTVILG